MSTPANDEIITCALDAARRDHFRDPQFVRLIPAPRLPGEVEQVRWLVYMTAYDLEWQRPASIMAEVKRVSGAIYAEPTMKVLS